VIDDIDTPAAAADQILIRVNSASLNFPDLLLIAGKYQVKPPLPFTPGLEVAGAIEAVGSRVSGFSPGQRVIGQAQMGGFAEFVAVDQASVHPLPDGMNNDEGAAFPLVYQTAYFGIAHRGGLKAGETVLIHSAAGGVGLAAVHIARALGAGKIIGTVGSDEKRELIRENGADIALNYHTDDFVDVVKRETGGKGVDIIYDPVGGEVAERSTKCIAFEGRLVLIGFTSGKFSNFVSNHILIKNYSVVGLHWGSYRHNNPAKVKEGWRELIDLYERARFKPVIGGRYPMEKAAEAMEFLASRKAVGKIVLHW
jgi:NADPH2:quinone reductase